MRSRLSSYALIGIDAVPVDVTLKGDQMKVVATRSRRHTLDRVLQETVVHLQTV
jgi:hypothetical protein